MLSVLAKTFQGVHVRNVIHDFFALEGKYDADNVNVLLRLDISLLFSFIISTL